MYSGATAILHSCILFFVLSIIGWSRETRCCYDSKFESKAIMPEDACDKHQAPSPATTSQRGATEEATSQAGPTKADSPDHLVPTSVVAGAQLKPGAADSSKTTMPEDACDTHQASPATLEEATSQSRSTKANPLNDLVSQNTVIGFLPKLGTADSSKSMTPEDAYNKPQASPAATSQAGSTKATSFDHLVPQNTAVGDVPKLGAADSPEATMPEDACDKKQAPPAITSQRGTIKAATSQRESIKATPVDRLVPRSAAAVAVAATTLNFDDLVIGSTLLTPEDRGWVPDSLFIAISQLEVCHFMDSDFDSVGRFRPRDAGFCGLRCRHCQGHRNAGRYFPTSLVDLTHGSSRRILFHVEHCSKCPEPIRKAFVACQQQETVDRAQWRATPERERRGYTAERLRRQRCFYQRLWMRLHGEQEALEEMVREPTELGVSTEPAVNVSSPPPDSTDDAQKPSPASVGPKKNGRRPSQALSTAELIDMESIPSKFRRVSASGDEQFNVPMIACCPCKKRRLSATPGSCQNVAELACQVVGTQPRRPSTTTTRISQPQPSSLIPEHACVSPTQPRRPPATRQQILQPQPSSLIPERVCGSPAEPRRPSSTSQQIFQPLPSSLLPEHDEAEDDISDVPMPENVPSAAVATDFTQVTDVVDLVRGSAFVFPEDRGLVPDSQFIAFGQLEKCHVTPADCFGRYKPTRVVGYAGLQCQHCHGRRNSGRFFPPALYDFTHFTSRRILLHAEHCLAAPAIVRDTYLACKAGEEEEEERRYALTERVRRQRSGDRLRRQKQFFTQLWQRLHGAEGVSIKPAAPRRRSAEWHQQQQPTSGPTSTTTNEKAENLESCNRNGQNLQTRPDAGATPRASTPIENAEKATLSAPIAETALNLGPPPDLGRAVTTLLVNVLVESAENLEIPSLVGPTSTTFANAPVENVQVSETLGDKDPTLTTLVSNTPIENTQSLVSQPTTQVAPCVAVTAPSPPLSAPIDNVPRLDSDPAEEEPSHLVQVATTPDAVGSQLQEVGAGMLQQPNHVLGPLHFGQTFVPNFVQQSIPGPAVAYLVCPDPSMVVNATTWQLPSLAPAANGTCVYVLAPISVVPNVVGGFVPAPGVAMSQTIPVAPTSSTPSMPENGEYQPGSIDPSVYYNGNSTPAIVQSQAVHPNDAANTNDHSHQNSQRVEQASYMVQCLPPMPIHREHQQGNGFIDPSVYYNDSTPATAQSQEVQTNDTAPRYATADDHQPPEQVEHPRQPVLYQQCLPPRPLNREHQPGAIDPSVCYNNSKPVTEQSPAFPAADATPRYTNTDSHSHQNSGQVEQPPHMVLHHQDAFDGNQHASSAVSPTGASCSYSSPRGSMSASQEAVAVAPFPETPQLPQYQPQPLPPAQQYGFASSPQTSYPTGTTLPFTVYCDYPEQQWVISPPNAYILVAQQPNGLAMLSGGEQGVTASAPRPIYVQQLQPLSQGFLSGAALPPASSQGNVVCVNGLAQSSWFFLRHLVGDVAQYKKFLAGKTSHIEVSRASRYFHGINAVMLLPGKRINGRLKISSLETYFDMIA
jgi:hypothetical protein